MANLDQILDYTADNLNKIIIGDVIQITVSTATTGDFKQANITIPSIEGYTHTADMMRSNTYRCCPIGIGGGTLYYSIRTAQTGGTALIEVYPVYIKQ